ncbi:MAG: bifunctional 4-hydroxy-2-oxoglutarate aldolase/2-dehydro-3-deoxy-phosphogluconate aldolase [Bacteroidota bacterium]
MQKEDIIKFIEESKIIAVVRLSDSKNALKVVEAIIKGGVKVIELTLTTPNAYEIIKELDNNFSDSVLIGAGSVLNNDMAEKAIDHGAKYIVSPILLPELIDFVHSYNIPVMVGAYTPTEIFTAQKLGSDIVKVFPADGLGRKYFQAIKAPMPHLKIMPTGGVSLTNAKQWIEAGAAAVGVGSALVENSLILSEKYEAITENAKIIVNNVK